MIAWLGVWVHPWNIPFVTVLADVAATDPISLLINCGVAGAVILLLVTGQLRTKTEVSTLEKRIAQQDEIIKTKDIALEDLTKQLVKIVPQLTKVGDVVEALPQNVNARLAEQMDALASRLDRIDGR